MKKNGVFFSYWLAISLAILSSFTMINAHAKPTLTYQDFARLPDVSQMALSPNGKKVYSVIYLSMDNEDGTAIEVTDLKTKNKKISLYTDNKKYDINWVRWKNNTTLLVGIIFPEKRTIGQGGRKFKTRETRLMIINTDTDQVSTAFSRAFLKSFYILPAMQDYVIDILPEDDDHILIGLKANKGMLSFPSFGVYKLNIHNQHISTFEKGQQNVSSWKTDQQHRIRLVTKYDDGINYINVKDVNSDNWHTLWQFENFSKDAVWPMSFDQDPNILYVRAYHEGRFAIFKVNLLDEKLTRQLVLADDKYDIGGSLIYSPVSNKVIGIRYSEERGYHYFDNDYQQLQTLLNNSLPKTNNRIISISNDEQSYLVYTNSDVDSGTYYYGKRNPSSLTALAYRYNKLSPDLMAPVKNYNYQARDGINIEAFLTLPLGYEAKNLPTIIFPHGGPIAKVGRSFDYWAQYLANKGYAVLQMNFRGSYGQGYEFMKAGLKNWGLEMQDDVQDGAKKLIADGITNPNKICILGASYGGYAALMGVVKTPDFYKCSVSLAGVSNVVDLVQDHRSGRRSYNIVDQQIGNDYDHLHNISPVNYAEKIKVPVLLIHGDSDRQVDIKHSIQMYNALKKADKKVTYVELENEDHYLTNNGNRLKTFAAIDKFLSVNLPIK